MSVSAVGTGYAPRFPSGCLCKECTADPEDCTIRRLQKAAKEAV
ncbi:MAG: hypothetical protein ACLRXP_16320 [Oscillospiraceae bacterium]